MTGLLLCAHVPYCFIYKLLIMNKRFRTLPFHDYIMNLSRSNTNFFLSCIQNNYLPNTHITTEAYRHRPCASIGSLRIMQHAC